MSFSKGVLLAEIFKILILEFFNRIGPELPFATEIDAALQQQKADLDLGAVFFEHKMVTQLTQLFFMIGRQFLNVAHTEWHSKASLNLRSRKTNASMQRNAMEKAGSRNE